MKDAQKPDHVALGTLIGRLREGRFVIPDFQRDFEWQPWDIRDLMKSVFLDYYIGSLLLWRGKEANFKALACEPIYGHDDLEQDHQHIVLDGQQRLTAMYYTFVAPNVALPNRSNRYFYFVHVDRFMAEEYDEAFEYDWKKSAVKIVSDVELQYARHIFPLSVIGAGGWALPNWVQGYESFWKSKYEEALDAGDDEAASAAKQCSEEAALFGEYIRDLTEQYQIAYIELDQDLDIAKVCDIFTQVNSKGVRLDAFDLINAMLKPKGLQLKHMWREVKPRLEWAETDRMNVYLLQVMSILRQSYCSPKYLYYLLPGQVKKVREKDGSLRSEILVPAVEDFEGLWAQSVEAVEGAIKLLRHPREFGAISPRFLPYVSIIPAFAALQHASRQIDPHQQLDAKRKIRHWYWASVFTSRYSGSVESTAARDFLEVQQWFGDNEKPPGVIAEFESRLRSLDLRGETKRGSSVYNGVFNLLVLKGARDWITGDAPQFGDLDDHHIVPKKWGRERGLDTEVDSILNRTPLTADTNRNVIRDRLPNEYLPELIDHNGLTSVRATLESHLISFEALDVLLREPFGEVDFEEFIMIRQRTIRDAVENLLIKERADLSPQLRDLDERLEAVELGIRTLIATRLGEDASVIPDHLRSRFEERVSTAARRNPAMDSAAYSSLSALLEFADLRDLQGIVESKAHWSAFEEDFRSKGVLATRFGQLAELRNGIRHSRTVGEIERKEGDAALIWFSAILGASTGVDT